jgi:hypothetical protein
MTETDIDFKQVAAAFSSIGKPFRGEIWEFAPDVPMGKGYGNDNKPFDIETACYLKPVYRAILNPNVRKAVIKAAVQTLKTYLTERCTAYLIVNEPGEMVVYDCDEKAAKDHCKSRLMPFLRSIPSIKKEIEEIENHHDITTTEFYLPGMTLRAWPLNESSTQRITLRYVMIHDAFLSKSTGMIANAIARTTQHPNDKKIIIESQGSDEGDDFDREFNSTDQGYLHVKCPLCGEGQPFEFERERPAEFIPTVQPHFTWEPPKPSTYSGFQRGPDELVLLPDGSYNAVEVMRNTYYECYHCGGKWHDSPETRAFLDESSYYVSANPNANPENVGFSWPNWINRRIKWGGDEVMMGYLTAKRAWKEFGNSGPLKIWYQKRAAKTWSEKLTQKSVSVITGSYDPTGAIPDESCRVMSVDCQQGDIPHKTGKFWYEARAIDKSGKNIYQLARGYAESWKDWIDVQKRLKIPNDNVAIDGGNYLHEVLDAAAANFEVVEKMIMSGGRATGRTIKARSVWKVLRGNGTRTSFPHGDKQFRSFSPPTYYSRKIAVEGGSAIINIAVYEWSNLSVKDHLQNLLMGGPSMPKFLALKREQLPQSVQDKEKGELAYDKQMQNEYRTSENGRNKWKESRPHVHYRDTGCQCLVLFDAGGYLGLPAAPDVGGQEA